MSGRWRLVRAQEFSRWKGRWQALNVELCRDHPVLHPDFIEPALRYFGAGDEYLAIWEKGGQPCGMMIVHRVGLGRWETWCPPQVVMGPVLLPTTDAREWSRAMFHTLGPTTVQFSFLHQDPLFTPLRDGVIPDERLARLVYGETIAVDTSAPFETYLEGLQAPFRRELRRRARRLRERFVDAEVVIQRELSDVAEGVRSYADLESSGWKGRAGSALSRSNAQGLFYQEVLTRFAGRGRSYVMELRGGGTLLASRLAVSNGDILVMLKTTYNEEFQRYGPGNMLLLESIQLLCNAFPLKVCEFYTRADSEKKKWATSVREIAHFDLFRTKAARFGKKVVCRARSLSAVVRRKG